MVHAIKSRVVVFSTTVAAADSNAVLELALHTCMHSMRSYVLRAHDHMQLTALLTSNHSNWIFGMPNPWYSNNCINFNIGKASNIRNVA